MAGRSARPRSSICSRATASPSTFFVPGLVIDQRAGADGGDPQGRPRDRAPQLQPRLDPQPDARAGARGDGEGHRGDQARHRPRAARLALAGGRDQRRSPCRCWSNTASTIPRTSSTTTRPICTRSKARRPTSSSCRSAGCSMTRPSSSTRSCCPAAPCRRRRRWLEVWTVEFDTLYAEDRMMMVGMHPQLIGQPSRLKALEGADRARAEPPQCLDRPLRRDRRRHAPEAEGRAAAAVSRAFCRPPHRGDGRGPGHRARDRGAFCGGGREGRLPRPRCAGAGGACRTLRCRNASIRVVCRRRRSRPR